MQRTRLGFDGRPLRNERAGLLRFSSGLIRALRKNGALELVEMGCDRTTFLGVGRSVGFNPSALPEAVVTHGIMPIEGAKRKIDVMLFLSNYCWLTPVCPTIVVIHDVIPWENPEFLGSRPSRLSRAVQWFRLKMATKIVTASENSRAALVEEFKVQPSKVCVIPDGLEERFSAIPESRDDKVLAAHGLKRRGYVLSVGTLERRKNIERLLEAFRILAGRCEGMDLVLVGHSDPTNPRRFPPLKKYARELGLGSRVRFLGNLPDEQLPAVYRGAAVFVFPSLKEGFGYPPLEAMACGTPVVCSNRSSLPEVVGGGALLVDPTIPMEISSAILRVIRDDNYAGELVSRGLARAQLFSWEKVAALWVREVEACVSGTLG